MRFSVVSCEVTIKQPHDTNFNPNTIYIGVPTTKMKLNLCEELQRQGIKLPESFDGKKFLMTWHIPDLPKDDLPNVVLPIPKLSIKICEVS